MKQHQKKHIVWIHSHFLYWMGGTKFIHEVLSELKKSPKVASIEVVVENASELAEKKYKELGIKLISMKHPTSTSLLYWAFFPYWLIKDIYFLKSYFKSRSILPSNVTIISSMFPMNVAAMMLPYRHVQNCYEPFAFFYDQEFIAKFSTLKRMSIRALAFIWSWLDKLATKQSNQVLTLNSVTADLIKEVYGVTADLTQAGVNSTLFKPYVSAKLKKKYDSMNIAIHSTDYTPVKGTDRVIKAMQMVVQKNKKAHLLITSTIENKEVENQLIALSRNLGIEKHVHFLGFVTIEELPQYYSLASVLVQGSSSSRSGTTSMALPVKEALCCQTPAIRPNIGAEDVVDGKTGYIVDPNDTKLLAEKMSYLLNHYAIAKKMGASGRKYVTEQYSWPKTASIFEKYL